MSNMEEEDENAQNLHIIMYKVVSAEETKK